MQAIEEWYKSVSANDTVSLNPSDRSSSHRPLSLCAVAYCNKNVCHDGYSHDGGLRARGAARDSACCTRRCGPGRPPRAPTYISTLSSLLFHLPSQQIITPFNVYFNAKLVFKKLQLWRLVTNFFYFGNFGGASCLAL